MRDAVFMPEVDEETKKWLESLPKKTTGASQFPFTEEMDKRIILAWNVVNRRVLAEQMGCCEDTLRKRYRYLISKGEKK